MNILLSRHQLVICIAAIESSEETVIAQVQLAGLKEAVFLMDSDCIAEIGLTSEGILTLLSCLRRVVDKLETIKGVVVVNYMLTEHNEIISIISNELMMKEGFTEKK